MGSLELDSDETDVNAVSLLLVPQGVSQTVEGG